MPLAPLLLLVSLICAKKRACDYRHMRSFSLDSSREIPNLHPWKRQGVSSRKSLFKESRYSAGVLVIISCVIPKCRVFTGTGTGGEKREMA